MCTRLIGASVERMGVVATDQIRLQQKFAAGNPSWSAGESGNPTPYNGANGPGGSAAFSVVMAY